MPAFKKVQGALGNNILHLMRRMDGYTNPLELTHQDVINLYAPPESRPFLMNCTSIANLGTYYPDEMMARWSPEARAVKGSAPDLKIELLGAAGTRPPLPKNPKLQPDADPEIVQKITRWIERRKEISIEFGRVQAVVNQLCETCTSPKQVRQAFPPILSLLSMDDYGAELAKGLQDYGRSRAPILAWPLRQACRLAAGTVTAAMLLPKADLPARQVRLTLSHSGVVVEFETEGGAGFRFSPLRG